jgi:hypothetical protein
MDRSARQVTPLSSIDRPLRGEAFTCAVLYGLALAHLVVMRCALGVWESPQDLNGLWQLPSVAMMKARPFECILYWHAYPSGFTAWWTFLIHAFGEPTGKLVFQWVNVALGAGLAPAAYLIALALASSRRAALVAAALVALSPSVPLFAAYYLYDLPSMALLTFCVACIACYQLTGGRVGFLVTALWLLGALVCLRSFFHLGLCVALFIWILCRRPGWRATLVAAAALVAPLALYLKNLVLFGVFGASTMLGFNLSKVNVAPLPRREAAALGEQGILPPIVARYPLFYPLAHGRAIYSQYGYNARGASPVVNQDDANNINLIAISKVYGHASESLIRARPGAYAADLLAAYARFCQPPARSGWFAPSYSPAFEAYRTAYVSFVEGDWLGSLTRRSGGGPPAVPSTIMLILPVLLGTWFFAHLRSCRLSLRPWRACVSEHPTGWCVFGLLLYATVLGTCCESGENSRYFLYVEPLYLCAVVGGVLWAVRWSRAGRQGARP